MDLGLGEEGLGSLIPFLGCMQGSAGKVQGGQSKAASAAHLLLAAPRAKRAVKHLVSPGTEQETFPVRAEHALSQSMLKLLHLPQLWTTSPPVVSPPKDVVVEGFPVQGTAAHRAGAGI